MFKTSELDKTIILNENTIRVYISVHNFFSVQILNCEHDLRYDEPYNIFILVTGAPISDELLQAYPLRMWHYEVYRVISHKFVFHAGMEWMVCKK